MIKASLSVCLFLSAFSLSAQRFGGTPPSVKWKQINSDTARIIFSSDLDSQAMRVAALVHEQARHTEFSLGTGLKKINIVLQNQTTIPNGYVGLGPYRSEFYLTAPTNNFELGNISWTDQLAWHEYRHVHQYNNFRKGISKLMGVLFGQEGYALAASAAIPNWFFEGDAVLQETIRTPQGRGRLPLFLNAYNTLWQSGKNYSWMKLRNGSLKDYVPDHYELGYLLVNYGNSKYGEKFWQQVTGDAAAYKGLFYPFQKAVKRNARTDYKTFRNAAFDFYKSQTEKIAANTADGPAPIMMPDEKRVVNQLFPYSVSENKIVYLQNSYHQRPVFIINENGKEKRVRVKDVSLDNQFSYRNGKIVYAAFENDARWGWRDYSVIKLLDATTGSQHTVTHRSKYFAPDISADGSSIIAVSQNPDGSSEIHLLEAATGRVVKKFSNEKVRLFTDPKFIDENRVVTPVQLRNDKMNLSVLDLSTGELTAITPASFNVMGYPCPAEEGVYFTASYGGSDQLFVYQYSNKKIYRITDWSLGNYFVNAANGKITWSAKTAEGYRLQQAEISGLKKIMVTEAEIETLQTMYPVSAGQETKNGTTVLDRRLATKRYPKSTGLLNFHSWRPNYADPEFSFTLYGENILNTLQTELYYLYNQNDQTNSLGFNTYFGQWFPLLNLGSEYTTGRQVVVQNKLKEWDQVDSRFGISIPLSWTKGRTFLDLTAGTNLHYRYDINKGVNQAIFNSINFGYLNHFISLGQQVAQARQHIFPRLGYAVSGNYRHVINKYDSWQALGNATLYLPGFSSNHHLVLNGGVQETDTLYSLFGNSFAYPRGYNEAYFSRMWRLSANYSFPIAYPDWGFANLFYLQRIRANGFYDYAQVYSKDKTATALQRSMGGELFFETKWWNSHPLSFGFRVSYLPDEDFITERKGATVFEFILPVSIIPR